jgi:hypothetical protein
MLTEKYITIIIKTNLNYEDIELKQSQFIKNLSYIIGSVDIDKLTACSHKNCISWVFTIPLTAAMRLFQSERLKESGKKPESRTVQDMNFFIDNFKINSINCARHPKEVFLTTESVIEYFTKLKIKLSDI